ncbi:MAG: hypothetical protein PVG14_16435, partial [Anaerolineales bacterium]
MSAVDHEAARLEGVVHHAQIVGLPLGVVFTAMAQAQVMTQLVHKGARLLVLGARLTGPSAEADDKVAGAIAERSAAAVSRNAACARKGTAQVVSPDIVVEDRLPGLLEIGVLDGVKPAPAEAGTATSGDVV